MNLRTLRAFVEVVRQGSFSQAAEVVFATQSSVSKAVKTLEDELGTPLFDRIGHRNQLTAAGEIAYRRALAILAERDSLVAELDELRGLKSGVLRIGLPPVGSSMLFAPLFAIFRTRHPGIEIQLVEHGSWQLKEMLLAGEVELAALLAPVDADLECQEVRTEPLMVLMPKNHPSSGGKKLDLARLADFPFILFEEGFALNPIILGACERRGFKPRIAARSAQIDFIVELVAAGLGIGFLPRMLAKKHQHPAIRQMPLDEPQTDWQMVLAWRRGSYLSPAARAWLALAREVRIGL
jgi:DNA-binding transcriptional LysR family regulator